MSPLWSALANVCLACLGYRVPGQEEMRVALGEMRAVFSQRSVRVSGIKAAAELNKREVPTPKGGRWHALTVMRLRQRLAVAA